MNSFSLIRLPKLREAQSKVASDTKGHHFRAGGVDLLDHIKEGLLEPKALVELRALSGAEADRMRSFSLSKTGPVIGAMTHLAELAQAPFETSHRALGQAAAAAANPGIRNLATVGGNLLQRPRCWYYRDASIKCLKKGGSRCYAVDGENRYHAVLGGGPAYIVHPSSLSTPLLALDAQVRIVGVDGQERSQPIAELFHLPSTDVRSEHTLAPGELLVDLLLPPSSAALRSSYFVAKERANYDWPLAEAAVSLKLEQGKMREVKVALGHVAPIPWDAQEAAAVLEGQAPAAALFERAAKAAFAKAKPLSDNAYKVRLGAALVRKALHEACEIPLPE